MSHFHANLLIVTATKVEAQAVFAAFRNVTGQESSTRIIGDKAYHCLGTINKTEAFLVESQMGAAGLGAALQTVEKGIEAINPSAVIMTGIAFGVNPEKQKIGDILVSKQLMLYESQRVETKGKRKRIIPRGSRADCSPMLLDRCRATEHHWKGQTVRFGLILSGEKLVDNLDFRRQLLDLEPEAIGGEMEGAGLYVACQDRKVDWILIKAICDWADGKKEGDKTSEWQRKAAKNAAQFVAHMIRDVGIFQLEEKSATNPQVSNPADRERRNASSHQKTILVVEDEAKVQRNIVKTLEREGYIVRTASDVPEAEEELEEHAFDLVVLDIRMPDFTGKHNKEAGLYILEEIKSKGLHVPVIILSANQDVTLALKAREHASAYFVKGDSAPKEFLDEIRKHLGIE